MESRSLTSGVTEPHRNPSSTLYGVNPPQLPFNCQHQFAFLMFMRCVGIEPTLSYKELRLRAGCIAALPTARMLFCFICVIQQHPLPGCPFTLQSV